ncbi:GDP-D-glucose phosphorylase 1 [Armigeres subalbatus]|uniref:GDP-D-glucose phosphorylase 1 n=1 Tax=Armigeres subalbatus TaxID=124917 RepID=UPI002ED2F853
MSTVVVQQLDSIVGLQQLIESRWIKLHDGNQEGVFRYQLEIERERVTDGRCRFLLQLNRKRTTERRKPDGISCVIPVFDPSGFNFNKVDSKEVLMEVQSGDCLITLMVNNSPLTKYHTLVVPDRGRNLAQILTKDTLEGVFQVFMMLEDRHYRMGFNSPGALASVNHLHYHLMHITHKLYIEDAPLKHLGNHLYLLENPARAYCFLYKPTEPAVNFTNQIFHLISVLLSQNIAHNLFFTWNGSRDIVRAMIYTRLKPCENKHVSPFNVAFGEMSGFVPLGDVTHFEQLDEARLEKLFREAQGTEDEEGYRLLDQTVLSYLYSMNDE